MPSNLARTKSARITLRTSTEGKALIEYAAAMAGTTVSSFILQNACNVASRIVAVEAAQFKPSPVRIKNIL